MIEAPISERTIIPGQWSRVLIGYSSLPYFETEADGEFVKYARLQVVGIGDTQLEITRIKSSEMPKAGKYPVLYFNGVRETEINLVDRDIQEKKDKGSINRLTRWNPRFLISEGERLSLAVRFPSQRIVQQLENNWMDLSDHSRYWEIMGLDKDFVWSQLEMTYLTTPQQ